MNRPASTMRPVERRRRLLSEMRFVGIPQDAHAWLTRAWPAYQAPQRSQAAAAALCRRDLQQLEAAGLVRRYTHVTPERWGPCAPKRKPAVGAADA